METNATETLTAVGATFLAAFSDRKTVNSKQQTANSRQGFRTLTYAG
jgi:hypothetical protein